MPLRKPDDTPDESQDGQGDAAERFPPEAYKYDAELKIETVALIQANADKVLSQEEWVVIDGVDKPKP